MKTTTATPRAKTRSSAAASKKKNSAGQSETLVISREAFELQPPPPRTISHHDIARLAMLIYHEEGCPKDRADAHWFEAERRLREAAGRYYRDHGPAFVTR